MLSLQRPYSLHCDFGSGLFSVPLELSGRKESGLRYASKTNYRTENYQLARHVLEDGLAALQVNLDEIQVELFASQQQHIMRLYCSKQLNNAFRFFWKAMGLAYANPPFSLLAKVLTKIAFEGGRFVMCTPDWGCSGGKNGPPNPQRRSSPPVATPTSPATPAPAAGDPKKRPQGDNATPEGNNPKKRRLAWMARSLIAAGLDVKFPDEE